MPVPIKILLSLLVLVVAAVMVVVEYRDGAVDVAWVAGFLGVFMVFAVWLFPETRKAK